MSEARFILCDPPPPGCENDEETCWWYDTENPLNDEEQPYVAIERYRGIDPNDFVRIEGAMRLLFTDQAEYYAVCGACYQIYRDMQWSGSTKNPYWQEESMRYLKRHQELKGWCEFCDPIFGNGGWMLGHDPGSSL